MSESLSSNLGLERARELLPTDAFGSFNILSAYTIILSRYIDKTLRCQNNIIIIMSIIEITEGKLDMLFIYKNNEIKEFQKYMKKYSYPNSDQLTILK